MKYIAFLLLVFTLIFSCTEEVPDTKPLFDFIPENATLVIEINDLTAFRESFKTNGFLIDLSKIETFKSALDRIRFVNFINTKSKSVLAFVEVEQEQFEPIWVVQNSPEIFVLDSAQNRTAAPMEHKGMPMLKQQIDDFIFFSTELGSKVLIGSSPDLLVDLTDNLKENHPPETLRKLLKISNDNKAASLYIDVKKSDRLFDSYLEQDSKKKIPTFSDWMSLDLETNQNKLSLSGISIANDSIWSYLDLFANTRPQTVITPEIAPGNSSAVISYAFDDYKIFSRNQQGFLGGTSSSNELFRAVNELGIIYANEQKTIVLNTQGSESLANYLNTNKKASFDYQGNEIMRLEDPNFLNSSFESLTNNFKANFCTIITNTFAFSETRKNLENLIINFNNETTFNKTATYETAIQSLAEESNLLFIGNSNSLKKIAKEDFSTDFYKELSKGLETNYTIAAQTSADKNFYHTNIVVQKIDGNVVEKAINELFSLKLDTTIVTDPQFVINHLNKKREVVVQDLKNNLYLISTSGNILWKKQLEGLIQGEIKQVDIFKNGRLQLAFTTNNQFMVLDRNGKEVKRFTKTYAGGSLNPLAVFDYDGKRNYRFVITQGVKTFMYNGKAEIVDGFTYTSAEKSIIAAPQHIVIGNKDHLLFKLEDGSLKILNRIGKERVTVEDKIDFSENAIYLNKNKFTLTDKKGTLYQIDESGRTTKTNFNLSNDHGMYATGNTLVLMNDNMLTIKGKQIELELGVYTKPKIFYLNNKIYVSVTDLQHQKIYLFDSQAKPIPNFPIYGNSSIDMVDIDGDKVLELVVKTKDNSLVTYKLN